MWVLIDVTLSGLFLTSTASPSPNPIFATKGERSETLFLERYRSVRLVKLDSIDMDDVPILVEIKEAPM